MLHDNLAVEIFHCFTYKQAKGITHNLPRDYCALSYRVNTGCKYTYSGKIVNTQKCSVMLIPDGIEYTTSSDEGEIYAIHFNTFNHSYSEIEILSSDASADIVELFENCIAEWNKKSKGYKYRVTSIFYKILEILNETQDDFSDNGQDTVTKSSKYIKENLSNPELSVKEIAKKANISEVYLRYIFKNRYGISPKEYLTKKRIKHAKYLIGTGYFSQKEIANQCGFADVKYFRIVFKKETGRTIKEYKEYYKQKVKF